MNSLCSSALISAVRARKPLWDTKDLNHHNRILTDKLWHEIAVELGSVNSIVKNRWRGLRDYYRQKLKRNCQQPNIHLTSWKHYDEMSFVGGTSNPRIIIKEEFKSSSPTDLDIHNSIDPSWQNNDNIVKNWPQPPSTYHDSDCSEDDDDLQFFKSILPDLKGLSRSKKVQMRVKILQLVHSELYETKDSDEKI